MIDDAVVASAKIKLSSSLIPSERNLANAVLKLWRIEQCVESPERVWRKIKRKHIEKYLLASGWRVGEENWTFIHRSGIISHVPAEYDGCTYEMEVQSIAKYILGIPTLYLMASLLELAEAT